MTPALFQYFASETVGVLYVEWEKGNGVKTTTTTTTTSKTTTTTTTTKVSNHLCAFSVEGRREGTC